MTKTTRKGLWFSLFLICPIIALLMRGSINLGPMGGKETSLALCSVLLPTIALLSIWLKPQWVGFDKIKPEKENIYGFFVTVLVVVSVLATITIPFIFKKPPATIAEAAKNNE